MYAPFVAPETQPALVALRRRREQIIDALSDHFARDHLDVDEFERRVDLAHRADTSDALEELLGDLEALEPSEPSEALVGPVPSPEQLALHRPEDRSLIAVLSGAERRGQWRVPKRLRVYALMGGAVLDFREVLLPPGETEVKVYAIMGGVEIIVPPGLAVECDGIGVLGGFESVDRAPPVPDPDRPLLRITGLAVMGGFEVSTRLPGESARQARRRRKHQRKRRLEEARRKQLRA
jgi:hypothetical protein